MTGHRPFGKICYNERERKLEEGKCKVWQTTYVYVCRVQQREGIIEDLIAQHDF